MGILKFAQTYKIAGAMIILATILLLLQSLALAKVVGGGFFPESDMANLSIILEFPTNYSLNKTRAKLLEAITLAKNIPEIQSILGNIGKVEGRSGTSAEGVYLAELKIKLSDKDKRNISLPEILQITQNEFKNFTDAIITVSIPSIAGGNDSPVQIEISGDNLGVLEKTAIQLQEKTDSIPGFTSTDTTVRAGKPKIQISPKREVLSESSIPAVSLGTSLRGNIEGLKAATFKSGDRNYDIVVKFEEKDGTKQIEEFSFRGKDGKNIPLTNFGDLKQIMAPIQILRKDKQRISKFMSYLDQGFPLGKALARIDELLKGGILPKGYDYIAAGQAEMMGEAQRNLAEAAIISMVLVVLTLSAIMESFIQPALILMTVPPMLIGMVWALYLTGNSISIFVIMGGVMLIGIVVNNAILILDHFNHLVQHEKMPKKEAIIQAAGDRMRPVLMITLAAVLGMLPMAFGQGIGAEVRNDVGAASAGGILSSGIISLFLIPVIYGLFLGKEEKRATVEEQ